MHYHEFFHWTHFAKHIRLFIGIHRSSHEWLKNKTIFCSNCSWCIVQFWIRHDKYKLKWTNKPNKKKIVKSLLRHQTDALILRIHAKTYWIGLTYLHSVKRDDWAKPSDHSYTSKSKHVCSTKKKKKISDVH